MRNKVFPRAGSISYLLPIPFLHAKMGYVLFPKLSEKPKLIYGVPYVEPRHRNKSRQWVNFSRTYSFGEKIECLWRSLRWEMPGDGQREAGPRWTVLSVRLATKRELQAGAVPRSSLGTMLRPTSFIMCYRAVVLGLLYLWPTSPRSPLLRRQGNRSWGGSSGEELCRYRANTSTFQHLHIPSLLQHKPVHYNQISIYCLNAKMVEI